MNLARVASAIRYYGEPVMVAGSISGGVAVAAGTLGAATGLTTNPAKGDATRPDLAKAGATAAGWALSGAATGAILGLATAVSIGSILGRPGLRDIVPAIAGGALIGAGMLGPAAGAYVLGKAAFD